MKNTKFFTLIATVVMMCVGLTSSAQAVEVLRTDSMHIQGASFLYGTVINPQGPVTIGDNLRVDGVIARPWGPVIIADDLRIDGAITREFGPVKISDGILQTSDEEAIFNGAVTAQGGLTVVGTLTLPDGSITADMLADGVGGSGGSLTDDSVTTSHIADGTITNADISASAAISASKISGILQSAPVSSQTMTYGAADVQLILQMAESPTQSPFVIKQSSGTEAFAVGVTGLVTTASINSASIVDSSIVNADISSSAAIGLTKLETGTAGQALIVGASGDLGYVSLAGDVTVTTGGLTTLGNNSVEAANIVDGTITAQKLASGATADSVDIWNDTGGELSAGTLVVLEGYSDGNGIRVSKADAMVSNGNYPATHVVETAISNLAAGTVYPVKTVSGLNTDGQSVGDNVYLAGSAGEFTFSEPSSSSDMAQVVGTIKTVNVSAGVIEFFPGAGIITRYSGETIQDSSISTSKLASSSFVSFPGVTELGYIDITGSVSDTETVTIDAEVYEFDTDAISTGVQVDVAADQSAAAAALALTAAINNQGMTYAYNVGDGTILIQAMGSGDNNSTLEETMTSGEVSNSSMQIGEDQGSRNMVMSSYTVTAQDLTTTNDANGTIVVAGSPTSAAPTVWSVTVRDSNGVMKTYANSQFSWQQVNSQYYVLKLVETQAAASDLAGNDVITVSVLYGS